MSSSYVLNAGSSFEPEPTEPILTSIFQQYERVIIESLISSFGLDFIVKDQHGGDVDTIHNVRQIGDDSQMTYKNQVNQDNYNNNGKYNDREYHKGTNYQTIKKEARDKYFESGETVKDAYTGSELHFLGKSKGADPKINAELDHVISAKRIHDDKGRVLSGLSGKELANSPENLQFTNKSLNASMQEKDIPVYIENHPELPMEVKEKMMKHYDKSRSMYEAKVARAYYTSPKFAQDVAKAAGNVSVKMGVRKAMGFLFAEIWFAVKYEFKSIDQKDKFELSEFFIALGNGVKNGFENAKIKYKELFSRFFEGAISGALSSLTTTICNIFFTTAKNVVKIVRQSYASVVQAAKILFINPENYTFGERMRAVTKTLSIGASVVVGVIISEAIGKTAIGTIPVVGDIVQTFCGTLITGIMSCTLLYFLDRNETINKLVKVLDNIHTIETEINYYRSQAAYFEEYAAKLMEIDIETFRQETTMYGNLTASINNIKSEDELNIILKNAFRTIGIKNSWDEYNNFDDFVNDKNAVMVFE